MAAGPEVGVARCLESKGFGVFSDTDPETATIFVGEFPARQAEAIVITAIGGSVFSNVQEQWTLEVTVRSATYNGAQDTARDIYNALHQLEGDIGGVGMRLRCVGLPAYLGRDGGGQGGRHLAAATYTARVKLNENTTT